MMVCNRSNHLQSLCIYVHEDIQRVGRRLSSDMRCWGSGQETSRWQFKFSAKQGRRHQKYTTIVTKSGETYFLVQLAPTKDSLSERNVIVMKLNCDFKIDERARKNSFVISVIANVQLESLAPLFHVLYVADVDYFHLRYSWFSSDLMQIFWQYVKWTTTASYSSKCIIQPSFSPTIYVCRSRIGAPNLQFATLK